MAVSIDVGDALMIACRFAGLRAVLFDLDGTLVDSVPDLAEAARRMLVDLGELPRTDGEIASFVGKGIPVLVERALTVGRRPIASDLLSRGISSFMHHYAETNGLRTVCYPGVPEVLRRLHEQGLKIACVTNKSEAFVAPLLAQVNLRQYIDCIVGGDTLDNRKPDPEPLWHACDELGVAREHVLMVGDSSNDALCARRAGIPVVLMTYGYNEGVPVDTVDCDGLLSSFVELLPLLGA
jgi:phosphoglycolate phosphatase